MPQHLVDEREIAEDLAEINTALGPVDLTPLPFSGKPTCSLSQQGKRKKRRRDKEAERFARIAGVLYISNEERYARMGYF